MARIFSISFMYTDKMHNAMVSVQSTPFHTEYYIGMMDESILDALPTNKIISTNPHHFSFLNISSDRNTPLMKAIIHAIAEHVQIEKVPNEQ